MIYQATYLLYSLSVKEARESEGCKVVIVEWLYESQAKKEPLGPEDFLVEFDQQNLNRTPAISKRKFEAERDYLAGSWKKPEDRPKVSLETLAGLLDPEYPSDSKPMQPFVKFPVF